MKKVFLLSSALLFLVACERQFEQNPDPNHTHADFAIWINGEEIDFSGPEFMSGLSTDEHTHDEADERHHEYLHLHDGVGHVLHSHKPGQAFGEFLSSLGIEIQQKDAIHCLSLQGSEYCNNDPSRDTYWDFYVNGERYVSSDGQTPDLLMARDYVFNDGDKLLLIYGEEHEDVQSILENMTDDACLYSKTCPWRGDPPAENCISDPAIPCVVPEEDL